MMPNYLYIAGCLLFTVVGQLLIKKGAVDLRGATSLWAYASNLFVIAGVASGGVAAFSWLKALQTYPLSYAYPFMSLSFLFVASLSAQVLGEQVRTSQWVGLGIVLLGLYVGSR
jgi:drug/metabolite transporter (DMT)-like permease